jgi:hypothetical protein
MKKKGLFLTLAVALIATIGMSGAVAPAQVEAQSVPALALDSLFSALNEGNTKSALGAFDARASVENLPGGESYFDLEQIAAMLEGWNREGRHFAVAHGAVTSIAPGLEMVVSDVEITDRGVTWGSERLLVVVHNGKIQRLYVVHARLTPSQYW